MKMLSSEVKALLDKLYNLRGEDSVILAKMNKEREEAIETGERTKNEKTVLLEKIDRLSSDEKTLKEEGEKLNVVLSSIDRSEYENVLDRLHIDFNPELITEKLNTMLPDTIKEVVTERDKASEELKNVEETMNDAFTKVEELGIRKDEALSNQAKLNEFFELALSGNINITRDEITGLLAKFEFSEDEQREAAKILMFPEDALYEFDAMRKSSQEKSGKSITDVLVEAKKESAESNFLKQEEASNDEVEEVAATPALEDEVETIIEDNEDELVVNESTETEQEKLINLLREEGIDASRIDYDKQKSILANFDEELIKDNINTIRSKEMDVNIFNEYSELLYDKELGSKIDKLLSIGKEAKDINLMPVVLVKYDLNGLNNTINVLQISGLDPRKVPLMAY